MTKQPNSQMCFVCGMENPIGLKLFFYENEAGQVVTQFTPGPEHQGYPGWLHGGIATAILDEVLGRTLIGRGVWMVTAKMEMRYRRAIPIGQPLTAVGEVISHRGRRLVARGELRLAGDQVGAEAEAIFIELPPEQAEGMEEALQFWRVVPD